ncbi:MAG TPA: YegP family protein [Flavobacterium sp.]|uniref:YegP family protein n=1 Tax=Flavobacterium sp. TaxID=239 RepID=UPI002CEE1020|nr:YegP family protein [Flavobacterium sp.]HNP33820.1 YegP family protein [Flavobacterium sp.]
MGKFVMTKRINGEYQFNLKSKNGLVILTSEGYSTKQNCELGIESVKRFAEDETSFEKNTASDGKLYFNLKASNGQIIGTSQMYGSDFAMEKGIASVKSNVADATIEDKTNKRLIQILSAS